MKIYLRANERIFINGAVLRVDRKASLELLNDATFLLENHVMQKEEANTPLKQLYYIIQLMLMDPANAEQAHTLFKDMVRSMLGTLSNSEIVEGIKAADVEVSTNKQFQALKTLRALFAIEENIMADETNTAAFKAAKSEGMAALAAG